MEVNTDRETVKDEAVNKEAVIRDNLAPDAQQMGQDPAAAVQLTVVDGMKKGPKMTKETQKLREGFRFFGPATAAYALFYAFCMYKNAAGITFPFFVASSLCYFYYTLKKLELTLKKGSVFCGVSVMLLAIATFCTADERIIALNKTGIFLLMTSFLLAQFYNTEKWGFGKYAGSIFVLLITALEELDKPIRDMAGFAKKEHSPKAKKGIYVALGLMLAIPLLILVVGLLSSADLIFRQMTTKLLAGINFSTSFAFMVKMALWYFGTYMLVSNLCRKTIGEEVKDRRNGEPIMAITLTSVLSVVYLIFSVIQILYLFLGKMQLPEGYTYAEYAREGFFQLLAVAILNLIIVLTCLAFFKESKVLKAILTVMSFCTFIMIASSAMRMIIYVKSYNLTFLRILVLWALAVLFFLFSGVVIQIFQPQFPLFRYGMTVVTVLYIGLAFSHPDAMIAKYNLENGTSIDYHYLAELSVDAAPVLIPYLKDAGYDLSETRDSLKAKGKITYASQENGFGYYYLQRNKIQELKDKMGIRNFNLSWYRAIKALE